MTRQPGVNSVMLSGLRATILMNEGEKLDQAEVEKALKSGGLKFESFEKTTMPRPQAAYELAVSGAT
ncbi:MAG: hypothetical protein Q7Q71_13605 [Verrucomicrobiota bacterium JB023]|nr:hypothetical protein [Verrucomicrobiota bacterium JB023]